MFARIGVLSLFVLMSACLAVRASARAEMPRPEAEAVWTYVTAEAPYQNWGYWPDRMGMNASTAPHGNQNKVFVNENGLNSQQPPVQYGTIEVKEAYDTRGRLKVISVMYKYEGYNPEAGDWFWADYEPNGKVKKSGRLGDCIRCHADSKKSDYIKSHRFK